MTTMKLRNRLRQLSTERRNITGNSNIRIDNSMIQKKDLDGTIEKIPFKFKDGIYQIDGKSFTDENDVKNYINKQGLIIVKTGEETSDSCKDCVCKYLFDSHNAFGRIGARKYADWVGDAKPDCTELDKKPRASGSLLIGLCPHDEVYIVRTYNNIREALNLPGNVVSVSGYSKQSLQAKLDHEEDARDWLDRIEREIKPKLEAHLNKINAKAQAIESYLKITK